MNYSTVQFNKKSARYWSGNRHNKFKLNCVVFDAVYSFSVSTTTAAIIQIDHDYSSWVIIGLNDLNSYLSTEKSNSKQKYYFYVENGARKIMKKICVGRLG